MANNKKDDRWIRFMVYIGIILLSTIPYVYIKALMQDAFLAIIVMCTIAGVLCVFVWKVFNLIESTTSKSEQECIKAEEVAEEVRKKQLAESQPHEVSRPEPQQPQIVVQNTIITQHEIINDVKTEVVNNVVNDINNNNVNIAEAVADSTSAAIARAVAQADAEAEANAPTEVNVEAPNITVTPTPVNIEAPVVNVEVPRPTRTEPYATVENVETAIDPEFYLDAIAAHEQQRKKRESDTVNAIMAYLENALLSLMPKDQIEQVRCEVMEWIKDPTYRSKNGVHAYEEFSTLDARHLIYNISARLGNSHGGHNRSWFVKTLFAQTCKELEEPAIYKNFKERPNQGHIRIDEPDKGSIAFHYDLLKKN